MGQYTDASGAIKFYNNEIDNYNQNHFQLLWNQKYATNWQSNVALHYTIGKGYFEQYKEDASFTDYNLPAFYGNNNH